MKGNLSFQKIGRLLFAGLPALFFLSPVLAQPCTPPVINLGTDITHCGTPVTLDAGNAGSAYVWSDNSIGQTLTVDTTGSYSVTVTNGLNCSASASISVTINPVPVVNLGADQTQCGGKVTLDAANGNGVILTDQIQNIGVTLIGAFYQTDLAQSFIPSQSAISGASIDLYNSGSGTGDITISLYTNLPNSGGTLLANGTATNVGPGQTASVSWAPVSVSPGGTYYLVFNSTDTTLGIAGSIGNPYAGGIAYANDGFQDFPGDDYSFQTFNATAYVWSDGSNKQQLTVSTSGNYTVTVTNAYNCSASGSVNVFIKPLPVVDLGPAITQCGGNVTLDAGTPGSTYRWSDASTQQFLTVNSSATYSVTVTDSNSSCTGSGSVVVSINPVPIVSLGPDIVQCGGSVTLNASNPGATYTWSNSQTTQGITVSTSGFYTVTVTNNSNCSATAGVNVLLNPAPLLGPDKTDSICPFTSANLSSYFVTQGWNVTYNTPTPTSVGPGVYTVIVSNQYGCNDTAQVTLNLRTKPNLGVDRTDSICPFTTADLTKYVSNPTVDINYGVLQPTAVPAGVYVITATNASGCADTVTITINYSQPPNLGADKTDSICVGTTYDLTALFPNTGYSSYNWNTGTPDAVTAGTYTLVVANASGCTDTATATITNREKPVVSLSLAKDICYTNGPFTLTGGLPTGGFYRIDSVVETTFDPVQAGIGVHRVAYIYINTSGCSDSVVSSITVHAQPFITTLMSPDVCTSSTPVDLNNYFTPKGGIYSGLGVSGIYFYPVITPSGQDTIFDLYTDQFGCADTSIYPVTVHQAVNTKLFSSVPGLSICAGQSVTLSATGAEQYEFFINGISQGLASTLDTFATTSLQDHDLVMVVGINECSRDTAGAFMFDVHPLPVVNAGPDTSIALGSTIQLQGSATGSGLLLYQWFPTKGLSFSTIPMPVYSGSDSVTFTLFAEDIYGCMDSDEVNIGVYIPDEIVLPNIITPDGDGKNDVWKINPKIDLTGSDLVIFDRWGETVYQVESYRNDWDGTYKGTGKKLADGTYYYVFKVPSQNNHVYRGAINVLNNK